MATTPDRAVSTTPAYRIQSLIAGFVSTLTLSIILETAESQINKLLRGETVDEELAGRVEKLVQEYDLAMRRISAERLKSSISQSASPR